MRRNIISPFFESGSFRFGGTLGHRIDTIARARIRGRAAREKIYPETEEAFRRRVDDVMNPGKGMWQGEFWGKWMLSVVAAYGYYGDPELKDFIGDAARGLISTQDGNGYIGTYRDSTFFGPGTWNIWSRKYTLWGLLECYRVTGDRAILESALRFCDHLLTEIGPGKHDIIRTGQFNGLPSTSILTPVVMLYRLTGEERFGEFARYIVDQWSKHPDGPPDILRKGLSGEPIHRWFPNPQEWAKSYELISCVEGMVALYEVTGEKDLLTAAENIHEAIVLWERSPVGSVSFNDKCIGSRRLKNTVAEICDAVYWNRLSHALLCITGRARYADEIERTLYNALLSAMNLDGHWGLRRLRMTHRHIEAHPHCRLTHHQCCVDNLPRGLFQAAQTALLSYRGTLQENHGTRSTGRCRSEPGSDVGTRQGPGSPSGPAGGGIALALLNPGRGSAEIASGNFVHVTIQGGYPFLADPLRITVSPERPEEFSLALRIPAWATAEICLPGGRKDVPAGTGWHVLRRKWSKDDTLTLDLGSGLRAEFFDPALIDPDDRLIEWHEAQWAKMGYIIEGRGQQSDLTGSDARPHAKAACFFFGPVALARDRRIRQEDLFAPITAGATLHPDDSHAHDSGGRLIRIPGEARPAGASPGFNQVYDVQVTGANGMRMCDFASAGNTWDEESTFSAWIPMDKR